MFKNYFNSAIRNLIRNKVYTVMNILGLTVGITCFTLIFLYVENEMSYDQFHNKESFRFLVTEQTGDGSERTFGILGVETHNQIAEKVAGIEDNILLRDWGAGPLLFEYKDKQIKTRSVLSAEPDFFEYFNIELIQGNNDSALDEPNNVLISESFAQTIFGSENPIGETFNVSGNMSFDLVITGVFKDLKNSHMNFDVLLNFDLRTKGADGFNIMREGFVNSVYGYFKLESGANPEDVAKRISNYYQNLYADQPEVLASLERESYEFQSVYDIYFNSEKVTFDDGFKKGNKDNLLLLGLIGIFILLVGCMNYINAATAKSINRAKEIGVRKVFGAFKTQLIVQFMSEAFLITFSSVLISILLTDLSLPIFENLLQTELRYSLIENPVFLYGLLIILFVVTFLSGIYPAIFLSRFKPADSLKMNIGKGLLRGNGLRFTLVGIQLFLTMVLISSVLLILKQSEFIKEKDLGFSKEDIVIVPNNSSNIQQQISAFENEVLSSPYVQKITSGVDVLGFETTNNSGRVFLDGEIAGDAPVATFFSVGKKFLDVQGLELIDGRDFDLNLSADSMAVIVNEAYLRATGIEDIVGRKVKLWSPEGVSQPVIGVVKDFNFKSLRSAVTPAIFMINERRNWFFTLKIDPEYKQEAITDIRNSWDKIEPNYPMGYMFLEDNLNAYYGDENRLYKAIQAFSIICILIACLGLYGMTSFTLERKAKEIGVRKVLGAKVAQLVWLVNNKFIRIVILASLVAIPVVYYFINQWLNTFAYHTSVGWFSFVVAILMVLGIVIITVSIQAIKSALANPVKTLRAE